MSCHLSIASFCSKAVLVRTQDISYSINERLNRSSRSGSWNTIRYLALRRMVGWLRKVAPWLRGGVASVVVCIKDRCSSAWPHKPLSRTAVWLIYNEFLRPTNECESNKMTLRLRRPDHRSIPYLLPLTKLGELSTTSFSTPVTPYRRSLALNSRKYAQRDQQQKTCGEVELSFTAVYKYGTVKNIISTTVLLQRMRHRQLRHERLLSQHLKNLRRDCRSELSGVVRWNRATEFANSFSGELMMCINK